MGLVRFWLKVLRFLVGSRVRFRLFVLFLVPGVGATAVCLCLGAGAGWRLPAAGGCAVLCKSVV